MAVVERAEREVVPELGVPLVMLGYSWVYSWMGVDLRAHVGWSDGVRGGREIGEGWSGHGDWM